MKGKEIVGSMSEWSGRLRDLFRQINDGSIKLEEIQAFLEHRNPFEVVDYITDWQNFYSGLGIDCEELSGVIIPDDPGGFSRELIMAEVTPQSSYDLCAELFPCQQWPDENLDKIVISDRDTKNGPYAIRFRDRVEADKELKKLSAGDLKERKISGITLEERLIYELKHFKETGEHLDIDNSTLCAGSRSSRGFVPQVRWSVDVLSVRWVRPDSHFSVLRSRQAVL